MTCTTCHHDCECREAKFKEAISVAREALECCSQHCLCDRSTKGFDYGDDHKRLGNPGTGARWLTPIDIARAALEKLEKILEGE